MADLSPMTESRAAAPDLAHSQVTETVRMLNLAAAQICTAMPEEQEMFEALLRGETVDQLLEKRRRDVDDSELF